MVLGGIKGIHRPQGGFSLNPRRNKHGNKKSVPEPK